MVIGKWMSAKASLYIIVEPTNGVDVGAIKELYDIISRLFVFLKPLQSGGFA
nr:hypothetical protein [Marinicella sp. W31]MDC2875616.1 hypothetical protein [Marinicella sp. W31]